MHIKSNTVIQATPEQVWPFLADPIIQAAWNPKIISIERATDSPVKTGETYTMIATMSGRENTSQVEVIDVSEPGQLVFRHHVSNPGREFKVTETFTISPTRKGTRVTHAIDLSQAGIPKILLLLISFLTRLGKSTGLPYLDQLRAMIESEVG